MKGAIVKGIIAIAVIGVIIAVVRHFHKSNNTKVDESPLYNKPTSNSLTDSDLSNYVKQLTDEYESHWYDIMPSMMTAESIVAVLKNVAYSMTNQGQFSQVLKEYSAKTNSDLFNDVENKLERSLGDGLFSHGETPLNEIKNHIKSLPNG